MDDEYWEGYFDDDPVETDELDEWGCLFGDRCLMPGEHLKKDCHTVEMMEQPTGASKTEPADSTTKKVLDGINLILKYEPSAKIAATDDTISFGSYSTKDMMTPHEQTQMDGWGWFEGYNCWARNV